MFRTRKILHLGGKERPFSGRSEDGMSASWSVDLSRNPWISGVLPVGTVERILGAPAWVGLCPYLPIQLNRPSFVWGVCTTCSFWRLDRLVEVQSRSFQLSRELTSSVYFLDQAADEDTQRATQHVDHDT